MMSDCSRKMRGFYSQRSRAGINASNSSFSAFLQYVLAKMVNHFSSFRSQKALRKTHFFENPFLRIWARVENSWEKRIFEQHFQAVKNSKEFPCKNEPFFSIEIRPISSKTYFLQIDHALRNLENSRKTHFIENPFLREHTVVRCWL